MKRWLNSTTRALSALTLACLAAVACNDSSGSKTGLMTVRLTDAPFPFVNVQSVKVFVVSVEARQTEATDDEIEDETDHEGWISIPVNKEFNLLDLAGGTTALLGASPLPTGDYDAFRLIIDPSQSGITLKDGTTPPIFWPSAAHSGIKIFLDEPINLTEDGSVMTLDFDIGRSFVMRGNTAASGFNFKPVIHAVAQDITGVVTGSVRANSATGPGVAGATVEVLTAGSLLTDTDPTHVVATGVTDANGDFRIAFLLPGTYVLRATPPAASGFKPALLPGDLTITKSTTTQNQIIVVAP